MSDDPFRPLTGQPSRQIHHTVQSWVAVTPVPKDAPPPPRSHPTRGRPSAIWEYLGFDGELLGLVCRFDDKERGKAVLPLSWCLSSDGREHSWKWKALCAPRPLYGLDKLIERLHASVILTEGEKAADAARTLLPEFVTTTISGGSKAVGKADWEPLKSRNVIIWPDADQPGQNYAQLAASNLRNVGASSISIIEPPTDVARGWDAADALSTGWSSERVQRLLDGARHFEDRQTQLCGQALLSAKVSGPQAGEGGSKKRTPQRDILLTLLDGCEFWHDANGDAYATFTTNGHHEDWPLRSREFKLWIAHRYFENNGSIIGGQAAEDALRVLEARAVHQGKMYKVWRRVARIDDVIYLDLCDHAWRIVEIDKDGWRIVANPKIKLLRSSSMRSLPVPEPGHLIEELRKFIPVAHEDDFKLVVAWLVAALRGSGPYPILVINGEQGSGKSCVSRLLRMLIDPDTAPIRSVPRDDRNLIVSAVNGYVLAYDNLSGIRNWLSDGLCRVATGSGYATRRLHTDREEEVFTAARPIILNGIPNLADRADLADRAITIHLPAIPEDERRAEDEINEELRVVLPRVLGALLDAVSATIRHLPETRLEKMPRMADTAKWVTAAERGLGWDKGTFLAVYESNRQDMFEIALEADMLAVTIRDFVKSDHQDGWEGKPAEFLAALNEFVSESVGKSRTWPGSASALGSRLRRLAPVLRRAGLIVEYGHSGDRFIMIRPMKKDQ